MLLTSTVSSSRDFDQILDLQGKNLKQLIPEQEKLIEGFVTMVYTKELLLAMHKLAPSIVVKKDEEVVAFALVFLEEGSHLYPDLHAMYVNIKKLSWKGKPMGSYSAYVMGQICIAKEYRGQGLFEMLYQKHKETYQDKFDMVVTEISTSNYRSLRAHERIGFKKISTYKDHLDEWAIVLWEF